jgi:hypothetical protein
MVRPGTSSTLNRCIIPASIIGSSIIARFFSAHWNIAIIDGEVRRPRQRKASRDA